MTWLHDNTLQQVASGGAERTNALLFDAMPDDITLSFLTPKDLTDRDQLNGDLLIVSNVKRFSVEQLDWVCGVRNRIRVERDYWNLINPDHSPLRKEIWEGSIAGVFTSPAHRDENLRLFPDIKFPETLLTIPSPIEAHRFWRGAKQNIIVYVGALDTHKGVEDVLDWAAASKVVVIVYGQGRLASTVSQHPNARYGGVISYDDIAKILAKANMFIHQPRWVEPYGRSVLEARLAGCHLLLNERIGCLSYDWWEEENSFLRVFLPKQGTVFWNKVMEVA